jgi:O-methyltransferase involved in polyketide biosynthesis
MRQIGCEMPMMSHTFRTNAFDTALLDALRHGAQQVVSSAPDSTVAAGRSFPGKA